MTAEAPDWSDVTSYFISYFSAVAILAAMQLDLFTPRRHGPRTCDELATDLRVDPRRLRMLLVPLASTKLITLNEGRVANSALAAEFLVRGQPRYMGGSHELYSDLFASVLPTAQSIRAGTPQAEHDWDSLPDEQLRAVLRGLNAGATAQGQLIARDHDFSRFETILDIGGGGAGFAMGACQVCPNLTAQVIELPRVARIAQELIDAAGLASRIRAVSHNIAAAPLPAPQPAAVVRNLLQVLSPERAQRVLENVGRSLRPGGEIFVIGQILDDDLAGPPSAIAFNLVFLNIYRDGEAHSESAYRRWLEVAGFVDVQRMPLVGSSGMSLMTGHWPG
jgi:SAM-dependent methyltransferase